MERSGAFPWTDTTDPPPGTHNVNYCGWVFTYEGTLWSRCSAILHIQYTVQTFISCTSRLDAWQCLVDTSTSTIVDGFSRIRELYGRAVALYSICTLQTFESRPGQPDVWPFLVVQTTMDNVKKNKPSTWTWMTHEACESNRIVVMSSMYQCPGNLVAEGCAVVYAAGSIC